MRKDFLVRELCSRILRRISELRELAPAALRDYSEAHERECLDNDHVAHFVISRQTLETGEFLVVVQGFVPSWRYPNFIGYAGIGHMYAEGLIVDEHGAVRNAQDEWMWGYR
jgi:hypothetical protein